ncbi:porin family protein [Grimontia sp. SpTr1]|uniref:porin family protein n=1 Tax=Grimontia sp. SpTr1 TaxID=2995319 RepID=UPI00248C0B82|nr:porin family protein [Grimontia sp. SpTr1]
MAAKRARIKKFVSSLAVICIAMAFSAHANAVEELNLGIKAGYQWAEDDSYHTSKPTSTIAGVSAGVMLTPSWGLDLDYQKHGKLDAKATGVHVNTQLISAALRYEYHWQTGWAGYGRLGAAYWDMDKTAPNQAMLKAKGISFLTEVGVLYDLTPSLSLSGGYQFIEGIGDDKTGQYDSHGVVLSVVYSLGDSF